MAEPEMIFQTVISEQDEDARRVWWLARGDEARERGMTWLRCSYHHDQPEILLFEAWRERPSEGEGELRFNLTGDTNHD